MTTFLDNWENSNCWDVQPPESQGDGEAVASDVPRPRPAASAERLPAKPEPLVLGAGALLALLGISVRYINTTEEAEQVVRSLVDETGHFGLDVETAKLTPYAHHRSGRSQPAFVEDPVASTICRRPRSLRVRSLHSADAGPAASVRETVCRS